MRTSRSSLVVATLVLALATGGVGYAAGTALPRHSVGPKQLKKNAVTGKAVKDGSLTGADVDESTLVLPAKAHVLTIPSYAFQPVDSDITFGTDAFGDLVTDASAGGEVYVAWLPVPSGATVTAIKAFIQDSTVATEASARSVSFSPATKTWVTSAKVTTVDSSPDAQTLSLPVVQPTATAGIAIQINMPGSSNLKLWGAEVDYTS